eukprot:CAMPEP_0185849674 /NCGR_PEP_ID=MMETSP1354-20130828/4104_1 /TAXON_ID=708628 /ORGANISM="Erythrolobus madagascarensis, Strain CCMP3276" /LENGTH=1066 /DNA_ID=CAMNT_0028550251 /DNA_START=78 /DNA_END=3278 /DNA_ORIENTATION=+
MTAILTGNVENITYLWEIIGPDGQPVTIPGLDLTGQSISFNYNDLPGDGRYVIRLTVTNEFGEQQTVEIGLTRLPPGQVQIIVNVVPIAAARTRAFPVSGLEINALVQVLNPPDNASIEYEWTYNNGEPIVFTPESISPDNTSTVARLGRNLFIPQQDVFPSLDLIPVVCRATLVQDRSITGDDTELISIVEAQLVAQINDGSEFTQLSSSTASYTLSGLNSFDPDVIPFDVANGDSPNGGLSYRWVSCEKSLSETLSNAEDCSGLLPQASPASFAVTSSDFDSEQLSDTDPTYFRFTLQVTKVGLAGSGDPRVSAPAQVVIQRLVDVTQDFSELDDIVVTTLTAPGTPLNLLAINPLEALLFTPSSSIDGTQWEFEFVLPVGLEDMTVSQIDNGAGYYDGINPSNNPMLLNPGALVNSAEFPGLTWRMQFTLEVRHFGPNTEQNTNRIVLETIAEPQVILDPLSITEGDENTIFSATAFSDFDGDQSILRYRFYWEKDGVSFCVNGCSGDFTVSFKISSAGTYSFRVELWDATGSTRFDVVNSDQTITVTLSSEDVLALANAELDSCFLLGDHACVEDVAFNLANFLSTNRKLSSGGTRRHDGGGAASDAAGALALSEGGGAPLATRQDDETTAVVKNALDKVQRSSGNSFPTTNLIDTYYEIAQGFGVLSSSVVSESDMLVNLLRILLNVRTRKESSTAVSEEAVDTLRNLFPSLPEIAAFLGQNEKARGSSRRRLLQNPNAENKNEADVYSSQADDLTFAANDNRQCGFFQQITIIPDNAGEGGVTSTPTNIFVSTRCSQAQNLADAIEAGSNSVSICEEVFASGLRKLGFHLVSSPDYPFTSGFDTSDAPADAMQLPQLFIDESVNSLPDNLPEDCFKITLDADLSSVDGSTNVVLTPFSFEPLDVVGQPVPDGGLYNRDTDGASRDGDAIVNGSTVRQVITVPGAGLYGMSISGSAVTATPTPGGGGSITPTPTPTSSGGGLSGGAIAGIVVGILVFLIIAILIAWLIATRCFVVVAPPVQEGFEYVERDIYGRGFVVEQSVFSDGSMVESAMGTSQMSPA